MWWEAHTSPLPVSALWVVVGPTVEAGSSWMAPDPTTSTTSSIPFSPNAFFFSSSSSSFSSSFFFLSHCRFGTAMEVQQGSWKAHHAKMSPRGPQSSQPHLWAVRDTVTQFSFWGRASSFTGYVSLDNLFTLPASVSSPSKWRFLHLVHVRRYRSASFTGLAQGAQG